MATYTIASSAWIGYDAINSSLTDAIGIDTDDVISRADNLFDADHRTAKLVWRPELSEIHTIDLDEDDEEEIFPEDFDPVEFVRECLRQAYEDACAV